MSWQGVRVASKAPELLRQRWQSGRFPHALLFVGPEGVGKRTFARAFAQAVLCEARAELELKACGLCTACRQVEADIHADLLEVRRPDDKQEISVESVRELCDWFAFKPMRGTRKIAILDDADDLTIEASNAFLKTLEEPPPGAILILISLAAELQLETIVSRCQVERFDPLPLEVVAELLLERGLVEDAQAAQAAAALGEGSMARALALVDPEVGRFRRQLIDEVAGDPSLFVPPETAARLLAFARQAGKESVHQRKRASLLVSELARFFQSALRQGLGLEPDCPIRDDLPSRLELARRLDAEQLVSLIDRCLEAQYHLTRRLYLPVVLESLMHDLGLILERGW